jgi:hypothetical protein
MNRYVRIVAVLSCLFLFLGCDPNSRLQNRPGGSSLQEDPKSPGTIQGAGIESHEIIGMTDQMMRDILATPAIMKHVSPPRIVLDAEYFKNESSSFINKNMITDRLRIELNRAADKKLVFITRENLDMVESEYAMEKAGVVTEGTQGETKQAVGYDYRLTGRIASRDMYGASGTVSKYHQISFELIERGTGISVWGGMYEFKKTAQDDILYR